MLVTFNINICSQPPSN